jgi:hypothetical protein
VPVETEESPGAAVVGPSATRSAAAALQHVDDARHRLVVGSIVGVHSPGAIWRVMQGPDLADERLESGPVVDGREPRVK